VKTLMFCAIALTLAAPAASQAAAGEESVAIAVRHGDLNLTQSRDAAIMVRRLDTAALQACGASSFSLREVQQATRESACFKDSMNRAVAALGSPTVNAIHRDRGASLASN